MIDYVVKRNESLVEFDLNKITTAIWKAVRACNGRDYERTFQLSKEVMNRLEGMYPDRDRLSVEEIQDVVEKTLVENGHYKVAKAYILYRHQHEDLRKANQVVLNNKVIQKYLGKNDWRIKENSNMTWSLQGMNFHISSGIVEDFWLNEMYPEPIRDMQANGDFHIHDLGILGPYCVGWDLKDLLMKGFRGAPGKLASKPAKHLRAILGQAVNFIYTLQGEAAGAQAFSNFDTLLAPFIRYDNLNYKKVKQALQEFIFNMNVPTRVGFQSPFSNLTMDLKVPEYMKNEPVIIGGEYIDATYGDFQPEMDILNQVFAEVMLEGDADGRVFTFPIPTYNITENFDWDNQIYAGIWEMTAKYGIPYFANYLGSDMHPEDARSMCCRLRIDNRLLQKRMGGLFASSPLTGSIGVVTVNMGRIGYLSKGKGKDEFFARLGMVMDLAKDSLEIKRKVLENYTTEGLYPYIRYYLQSVKDRFGSYWANHFSTIGLLGMNEACLNYLGCSLAESEGEAFAIEVLEFLRSRIKCYQDKTGNLYNLEATPAEGASYRLAQKDKENYPDIICAGTNEVPYYTNSTQLPVNYTDDLFEALTLQEPLQSLYTGGTVFHCFMGEKSPNPASLKRMVRKVCESFTIPYFTITPTFSVCPSHGYMSGEHFTCPVCGTDCEVYSRVVGYIRPVAQFNKGKFTEYLSRKTFDASITGQKPVLKLA